MDKQKKEEKAQELFKLHYDELCDPDKKHVREAIKSKRLYNQIMKKEVSRCTDK